MTKEEILAKSRAENGGKDVFDAEVQKVAAHVAYFASFGLCALVSLLQWIFTRRAGVQCWIVFFGMLCVAFVVKFLKMKKRHELVVALCYLAVFALLAVVFVLQLTGRLPVSAATTAGEA